MAALPLRSPEVSFSEEHKAAVVATMKDSVLFSERMLKSDLWGLQAKIIKAIETNRRVAVKACHASSKTYTAARVALWWLARYKRSIVVTTAPTNTQVEKLLWGEIHAAIAESDYKYPKPLLTELKFNSRRYALGFSTAVTKSDEGVKAQGFHEDHVLIIIDEAPGVHPKIFEAVEGARAGGDVRLLLLGNPTIGSGPFFDAFGKDRSGWKTFTISAFDTPNLEGLTVEKLLELSEDELDIAPRPYLITRRWVKEKFFEWGPSHPSWESRVLGQFPTQADDALISLAWLEKAKISDVAIPTCKARAGLDVAGPGEDETVLTIRRGPRIILQKWWAASDPRGEVIAELRPFKDADDLDSVNVDCIGIGWGMYTHLLGEGFPAVPVNVGEAPRTSTEDFVNLKAELYWALRLRLQAGDLSGMTDEKTIGQLAGIRYEHDPRGRTKIESKEDARKRGVHSPDRAESVMLAFAELGTGLTIYRTAFTEDLIYNDADLPIGFGSPGSFQNRVIAVAYGTALGVCFLDCLDTGQIIYVSREYYFDPAQATNPKSDAEYVADLKQFVAGVHPLTGETLPRYDRGTMIVVRDDEETEHFCLEISRGGLSRMPADVELSAGIQLVGSAFEKKIVKVSSSCRRFINEHKAYAWDSQKLTRGVEEPVGTNKQTVEAFRHYVKTRIGPWRLK